MKKLIAAAAASMIAFTASPSVFAGYDAFGLSPAACQESVTHYMGDRLYDARSARVRLDGDPYKVLVEMRGGDGVAAWAQDVRVKSRLPSGSWSNYQSYTVIFQNGVPVALASDVKDLSAI